MEEEYNELSPHAFEHTTSFPYWGRKPQQRENLMRISTEAGSPVSRGLVTFLPTLPYPVPPAMIHYYRY